MSPLVTIICLCYNQKDFVQEAVQSVIEQDYPYIELIIVDDASTDGSQDLIKDLARKRPKIKTLLLNSNQGNCKAFNQALDLAKGKYIIDLAADDVLCPNRVSYGVEELEKLPDHFGVHYGDAILIDKAGALLGYHFAQIHHFKNKTQKPSGDVYKEVLEHYFIASPTMMIKKKVLNELGGYDPDLDYEDFDFWIRSARNYYYAWTPEALIKKRILKASFSARQYGPDSKMLFSTVKVCEKALALNRTYQEHQALTRRINYELKLAVFSGNHLAAKQLIKLYDRVPISQPSVLPYIYKLIIQLPISQKQWQWLYLRLSSFSSILR